MRARCPRSACSCASASSTSLEKFSCSGPPGRGGFVDLLLQGGRVEPFLGVGTGPLLGLPTGLLGRLGDTGVGVAARIFDRLPGSLLDLTADALGLLPGPLLGFQAEALGLLPNPPLHGLAGLLLGLPPGLLGGHLDQLLRLLLGSLRPIRGLGLERSALRRRSSTSRSTRSSSSEIRAS